VTFWAYIWNRLKALPAGVWAALGAALALLGMYLRGRRLEAQLAEARLRAEAAKAAAVGAKAQGAAEVHLDRAKKHEEVADDLQKRVEAVAQARAAERERIANLPPDKVTREFLKLTEKKKRQRLN
jgi:hypothetical protein